eukprot:1374383-Rhodomonas_salina.1
MRVISEEGLEVQVASGSMVIGRSAQYGLSREGYYQSKRRAGSYQPTMRCPVVTYFPKCPAPYAFATRTPVLRYGMLLPGGGGREASQQACLHSPCATRGCGGRASPILSYENSGGVLRAWYEQGGTDEEYAGSRAEERGTRAGEAEAVRGLRGQRRGRRDFRRVCPLSHASLSLGLDLDLDLDLSVARSLASSLPLLSPLSSLSLSPSPLFLSPLLSSPRSPAVFLRSLALSLSRTLALSHSPSPHPLSPSFISLSPSLSPLDPVMLRAVQCAVRYLVVRSYGGVLFVLRYAIRYAACGMR